MNAETVEHLEADESNLELPQFDLEDAWELGTILRSTAQRRGFGVAIDIRRATGMILFRTALQGVTRDQEDWLRRKAALVFRFETSSAIVAAKLNRAGVDPAAMGWLDPNEFALAGGSVPVRVVGAGVVAAVTVSGLSSEEDHALAVSAIRDFADRSIGAGGER